jgi:hypothetical protein
MLNSSKIFTTGFASLGRQSITIQASLEYTIGRYRRQSNVLVHKFYDKQGQGSEVYPLSEHPVCIAILSSAQQRDSQHNQEVELFLFR